MQTLYLDGPPIISDHYWFCERDTDSRSCVPLERANKGNPGHDRTGASHTGQHVGPSAQQPALFNFAGSSYNGRLFHLSLIFSIDVPELDDEWVWKLGGIETHSWNCTASPNECKYL